MGKRAVSFGLLLGLLSAWTVLAHASKICPEEYAQAKEITESVWRVAEIGTAGTGVTGRFNVLIESPGNPDLRARIHIPNRGDAESARKKDNVRFVFAPTMEIEFRGQKCVYPASILPEIEGKRRFPNVRSFIGLKGKPAAIGQYLTLYRIRSSDSPKRN